MYAILMTSRGRPTTRPRGDLDRVDLVPPWETTSPEDLQEPTDDSRPSGRTAAETLAGLRNFKSKFPRSSAADSGRASRLLAQDVSYIAHPSFNDPSARGAILTASSGFESDGLDRILALREFDADSSSRNRIPSRELEAHLFRKMNYLKYLASRIRDRIDPDSPSSVDVDEIERLQIEAVKLKNEIVETHLRLVVSVAKKHARAGYDLPERISDGTFALMQAVDRFDFSRGYRFSTYAYWSILNELSRHDRKERRRKNRSVGRYLDSLASPDSAIDGQEHKEAQNRRTALVGRWLDRLDKRERRILARRYGLGGRPEQSLSQIGRDLGISKERVRQLLIRAQAKLRGFARLEALEPSTL
jgi:RNA polymerase primary sigma factor